MTIKIFMSNVFEKVKSKINNPAAEKINMCPHPASGSPSPRMKHILAKPIKIIHPGRGRSIIHLNALAYDE